MQIKLRYRKEIAQGGFGGKGPNPPEAPKPPSPAGAASNVNAQGQPARRGIGASILTTGQGVPDQQSNKRTILGG